MIKTVLRQTSLLVLSSIAFIAPVRAADWTSVFESADSAVEATKFFKDNQSRKDIFELDEDLGWGLSADKTKKAYKNVSKEIKKIQKNFSDTAKSEIAKVKNEATDSLNTFKQGALGNASTFSGDALNATKKQLSEDIQQKAKDIASGKELTRLLNERVSNEMKEMGERTDKNGTGFETLDPANVGMFNLDSVFGADMANGGVRKQDTKSCSSMGLADAQRGDNLGMACCLKWAMGNGEEPADSGSGTVAKFAGALAICCAVAPDYCLSWLDIAQEKAACLNGNVAAGGTMEEAWKTCEIECGKTGYGELVHNTDGKYDPKQVEDLMKSCYNKEEDKWQPSPTVLTASELAPVVPEEVKGMLK